MLRPMRLFQACTLWQLTYSLRAIGIVLLLLRGKPYGLMHLHRQDIQADWVQYESFGRVF
jgi:hypothetical protein